MLLLRNISAFVILLLCASCTTQVTRYIDQPTGANIASCGAGLEAGLRADLQAKYQELGGQASAEYQNYVRAAIFSNATISSAEKQGMYASYTKCVLELDERNRQDRRAAIRRTDVSNICLAERTSCTQDASFAINTCLNDSKTKCLRECRNRFGLSASQCVKNCAMEEPNVGLWTSRNCASEERESAYDKRQCEAEYSSCMTQL